VLREERPNLSHGLARDAELGGIERGLVGRLPLATVPLAVAFDWRTVNCGVLATNTPTGTRRDEGHGNRSRS